MPRPFDVLDGKTKAVELDVHLAPNRWAERLAPSIGNVHQIQLISEELGARVATVPLPGRAKLIFLGFAVGWR